MKASEFEKLENFANFIKQCIDGEFRKAICSLEKAKNFLSSNLYDDTQATCLQIGGALAALQSIREMLADEIPSYIDAYIFEINEVVDYE